MKPSEMQEPPTGSVVAINWGGPRQEVWVSNSANIGNWFTPDIPLDGTWFPTWHDLVRRAKVARSEITLLVAADENTYRAGYNAGVSAAVEAATNAMEDLR